MKTLKLAYGKEIPKNYTGIIEWEYGSKEWYKNGIWHREDGPAYIRKDGYKEWWLDGKGIWDSTCKLDLTNQIILSKVRHPLYPTVQIWKILGKNGLYEQFIVPGMEEFIKE